VRLLGINAPESDECYGPEAAAWLRTAIVGREIRLARAGTDQYERTLARVVLDDRYINREAVATGHALVVSSVELDRGLLLDAEREARDGGLGLWSDDICGAVGARASLTIAGIDHDPPGPDLAESVTIQNAGSETVNLAGFVVRDESSANRFVLPAFELEPGHRVSVVSGSGDLSSGTFEWRTAQPVWNNEGDTAFVLDPRGRIVATYRY
jgi:micrococcal nuclease